jgi:DGQHR domain-containing protein
MSRSRKIAKGRPDSYVIGVASHFDLTRAVEKEQSMLATRVLQKEGTFYFIAYPAAALLDRVNFSSRYYFEGEHIEADEPGDDEVARFIAGVEKSEGSFQRLLNRRKIRQIVNFYETAVNQPLIPGTILLFTDETLRFRRSDSSESVGFLSEPNGKYLIIDGQHRLAALHFFRQKHPDQIDRIEVPCVLFDGKSADFATEMFVIINSTHTRSTSRISSICTSASPGKRRKKNSLPSWSTCFMKNPIRHCATVSIVSVAEAGRKNGFCSRRCSTKFSK